jgi:hypothetical protein
MNLLAPETINLSSLPALPLAERHRLPDVPGIYFVMDAADTVHYIGRTKSLWSRWHAHHRRTQFSGIADLRIAYLIVTDSALLPQIEEALIDYFAPLLNRKKIPSGFATIQVKVSRALRDRLLSKLRARGTTLRAFVGDMIELVDADDDFMDTVEMKRMQLGRARARLITVPHKDVPGEALVGARDN